MVDINIDGFWKRIVNTMNEGLMLIGPEGTILMVNQAFEDLTGYSTEDAVGKPCTLLKCDACEMMLSKESGYWCALFSQDRSDIKQCRCMILKKDGTWLPALKNASVLKEGDQCIGVVETITDISALDELREKIKVLSDQVESGHGFHGIIGKSGPMEKVFHHIRKAAQSDLPVVIYGESGTGKELVAHAIHELGPRSEAPFIQFNCAALNESLIESELFGHTKGAFTGADRHRLGRFEAAHGGDIFLDEIGDIPPSIQVKLLRILESRQFERVGDHRPISIDVRLITATNKNIGAMIDQNMFREDLYFRINIFPIHLPPLRERKEDIPLLVSEFIRGLQKKTGKAITGLSRPVMETFMSYSWPGNIRELKSTLEYAFVLAERGLIAAEQLPPLFGRPNKVPERNHVFDNTEHLDQKEALVQALRQCEGNQSQAARLLNINRVTVWNRIKKYGIDLKKI